jgi:outer membrane beta-barrel protein
MMEQTMNKLSQMRINFLILCILLFSLSLNHTFAQDKGDPVKSERINVEKIKERYWNKGDENELRVVQNRIFTKDQKIQVSLFGGTISTDPFLKVYSAGGSIGYNFTEYWGINALGWKFFVSDSSAAGAFRQQTGKTTNTNFPQGFFGLEGEFSPVYGKLSLLGKAIVYYDLHLMFGGGYTTMESGTYLTPLIGIGQQFYIAKQLALRLDYRITYYNEKVLQKYDQTKLGTFVGSRDTYNSVVALGLMWLVGF